MLSSLRPFARGLRDRLEGRFFRLWCLVCRIPIDNPRRRLLCRHGLRHLREGYWSLFVLEKYWVLWRYVLLIEMFAARPPQALDFSSRPVSAPRILFIRLGHFGDLLHLVPLVRGMRQSFPDATLDVLVGAWGKEIAERIPDLNKVLTYSPHFYHLNRGQTSKCLSWRQEWDCRKSLAQREYDYVVSTQGAGLADLSLIQAMDCVQWIGPPTAYNRDQAFGRQVVAPLEKNLYEATRVARLGHWLDCEITDDRLEYWITAEEESEAQSVLDQWGTTGSEWVVLCPAAGWPGKQWPLDRFAEIADRLIDQTGLRVLLCGAPHERPMGEAIASRMTHEPANLMGATSWGVLAALIRDAKLFVGGDSGPMHLAEVYETPCVCLFGPTRPEQWGPRGRHARIIRKVSSCPDCWPWHPGRDCVHDRECMKAISVEDVWLACEKLLASKRREASR